MSVISNPSAGNVYFDNGGTAITSTTQPKKDSGAVAGTTTAALSSAQVIGVTPGTSVTGPTAGVVQTSGADGIVSGYISGGTFAYMAEGDYVIRGESTMLNGTANTTLRFPAANSTGYGREPIHSITGIRTTRTATAIRAGYWNEVSGTFSTDPSGSLDSFGSDDVAAPSAAEPGELAYQDGSADPTTDEYQPRNLW